MIYSQTFATDILGLLSHQQIETMLALQYLSALSIKKQMADGDKFYLITDTKGKNYTINFPYDEILTALDDYPHARPFKMSAYKLYAIEVFKNQDFVHFDNDVILFRDIPSFDDTIVQSCEGNFAQAIYTNKIRHLDWIFPEYIHEITHNYNPGLFGFTKDSKVRDIYYQTALKYSNLNIAFLNMMGPGLTYDMHLKEMQDVYLILEEGLLWYLCNRDQISVCEFLPEKFVHHPAIFGTFSNGKFSGQDWMKVEQISYHQWKEQKYVHLMNYFGILRNYNLISVPQQVFLEVYRLYPEEVSQLLNRKLWKL